MTLLCDGGFKHLGGTAARRDLSVHNRERINLDEIARRKGTYPYEDVGRLVIAE